MRPQSQFRLGDRLLILGLLATGVSSTQGCAGRGNQTDVFDSRPAYLSRFPTLGSNLKAAPKGKTIPASGLGLDMVKRMHKKAAKFADDAVGQVAAPGFATVRPIGKIGVND